MAENSIKGKSAEHKIFSMLLEAEYDVYAPLCDDKGIDCVVRKDDGSFVLLQIKSSEKSCKFNVRQPKKAKDYYFVFYTQEKNCIWVVPSEEFVKKSSKTVDAKGVETASILLGGKKPKKEYEKYRIETPKDFCKFF